MKLTVPIEVEISDLQRKAIAREIVQIHFDEFLKKELDNGDFDSIWETEDNKLMVSNWHPHGGDYHRRYYRDMTEEEIAIKKLLKKLS